MAGTGRPPELDASLAPGAPRPAWLMEVALPGTSLEPLNALFVAWAVSALEAMGPLPDEDVLLVEEKALVAEAPYVFSAVYGAAVLDVAAC